MRKPHVASALLKLWRSPWMLGTPIVITLLVFLWWAQQSDVNSLTRRIRSLKRQIREIPTEATAQKRVAQELDTLQAQIDALPTLTAPKTQLQQQLTRLQQTAATAPDPILPTQVSQMQQQIEALPNLEPQKQQLYVALNGLKQRLADSSTNVTKADRLTLEQNRLALEQDQITLQNSVYGSLIQALGALFFCGTAFFTWRYLKTTEDKQIIERFSQAIEHLGSDRQEVRVGGIYALERIAKDSDKDYWTVMEVLTAFVHLRCPEGSAEARSLPPQLLEVLPTEPFWPSDPDSAIARDVQAALRVLGRREVSRDPEDKRLDLSRTNLAGAVLKGVNLQRAELREANLCAANLREADLSHADLSHANLRGALLGLSNLRGANLTATDLSGAELIGGRLRESNLMQATLADTDLRGVDLRKANLKGVSLRGANLKGANLKGVLDLTQAQLNEAQVDATTELPEHLQRTIAASADASEPQHL